MDDREELIRKINELEEKLKRCQQRQQELENLIEEYNDVLKKQFQVFDDFFEKLGTKKMIDPLTRVYSKDHFLKLLSYQHQRSFEENTPYTIFFVKVKLPEEEKERILMRVGKVLKECVRVPLDSVGRYSDDTFALFVVDASKTLAPKIKERIENFLKNISGIDYKVVYKSYPEDFMDLDKILSDLEKAVS
ncbi:diguanylate cyclase domain-containing protein [Thermotoga sp. KOL6]|uniref:diguanylate cyclase domain-containing protein n=1 Tax=Thermotoga sp. KOL6 TaxID=126741 RepID=UPI000C773BD5|nr:diguanylate cyclase [Thermotoga sp. KOL6]PLV58704.1 diguanylate cyclase [Thermotoga sp. KOL6]